MFYKRKL